MGVLIDGTGQVLDGDDFGYAGKWQTYQQSKTPTAAKSYGMGFTVCNHVQETFEIGEHKVLLTAGHDVTVSELDAMKYRTRDLVTPDVGIYFDGGWPKKLVRPKPVVYEPEIEIVGNVPGVTSKWATKIKREWDRYWADRAAADSQPDEVRWPYLMVDWPDRGILSWETTETLVTYTLKQVRAGKVVDMGCAGAHGRTGTFLAMLLIDAENLTPEVAISEVRRRHCDKAIESASQVRAIFGYAGQFATSEEVKRLS